MSKWNTFENLVEAIAPKLLGALPGGAVIVPMVTHAIQAVQEFHSDKTGADKLATAVKIFYAGATAVNAKRPNTIPLDTITALAESGISAVVDAANLAHVGIQAQDGVSVAGGATSAQLQSIAQSHAPAVASPMTVADPNAIGGAPVPQVTAPTPLAPVPTSDKAPTPINPFA